MDVGHVRHWPAIARSSLKKIFPHGRTVHIPSDGKPLLGYAAALAAVERRGNAPNRRSLDAARAAGVITEGQVREAELIAAHPGTARTVLASLTGSGNTEAYSADSMLSPASRQAPKAPMRLASLRAPATAAAKPAHHDRPVPLPPGRPRTMVTAHAKRKPAAEPVQTASLVGGKADSRNIWGGVFSSAHAADTPFNVAATDPAATGSAANTALAYADESDLAAIKRVSPMGAIVPPPPAATVTPAGANAAIATKAPVASGGMHGDSPWLRATLLTPNVSDYMTATRLAKVDPKWMSAVLHKPEQAVMTSFSADPSFGMVTSRFTGHAVVFLATATFVPPTKLSLR
ncbi:MAG: hypothetical protein P8Y53_22640, partial [Pseudolabrys sp.]